MSFDMTEKLIHSIGLDDDNTEMMIEIDIKNESMKVIKQEIEEEIKERKKDEEGIDDNDDRLKKDEIETEIAIESDEHEEMTEKDMKILEPLRTHESGSVLYFLLLSFFPSSFISISSFLHFSFYSLFHPLFFFFFCILLQHL